jgi:3-deoxy-D-arabino-heptulosonate 7-phosphate (DAHP) synthase class II
MNCLREMMKMKIVLSLAEQRTIKKMVHIGDERDIRVYDSEHKVMLKSNINPISCDCGKKFCEHKKLLMIKQLMEYKVKP